MNKVLEQIEDEYWMRVCEKDQAWKSFCKCASDANWNLYKEAQEAEKAALKVCKDAGIELPS